MSWVSVKERLPKSGVVVLVFRPQVLKEDNTDKPIREAYYDENAKCFSCWHQPTEWMEIKKPKGWNEDLRERQTAP